MADQMPPAGISAEDWAATPVAVHALVMELLRRLAEVEARLNQTSRNSSKTPRLIRRRRNRRRVARRADSLGIRGTDAS